MFDSKSKMTNYEGYIKIAMNQT